MRWLSAKSLTCLMFPQNGSTVAWETSSSHHTSTYSCTHTCTYTHRHTKHLYCTNTMPLGDRIITTTVLNVHAYFSCRWLHWQSAALSQSACTCDPLPPRDHPPPRADRRDSINNLCHECCHVTQSSDKQMAQWVLKPAQWSQCEEMPQATIAGYPWPSVHTAMCSTPLTKTAVEMSGSSVLRASELH